MRFSALTFLGFAAAFGLAFSVAFFLSTLTQLLSLSNFRLEQTIEVFGLIEAQARIEKAHPDIVANEGFERHAIFFVESKGKQR